MQAKKITLGGREFTLAVSAYTAILYEDNFKGRSLLRDLNNILGKGGEVKVGNYFRFLWALMQTAQPTMSSFEEFMAGLELDDVLKISDDIVELLTDSLSSGTVKNLLATVQ